MISAIFFPGDPEARVEDLVAEAKARMRNGLRLYTNGQRFALLSRPLAGWALWK